MHSQVRSATSYSMTSAYAKRGGAAERLYVSPYSKNCELKRMKWLSDGRCYKDIDISDVVARRAKYEVRAGLVTGPGFGSWLSRA
jgi:hypothetical protein